MRRPEERTGASHIPAEGKAQRAEGRGDAKVGDEGTPAVLGEPRPWGGCQLPSGAAPTGRQEQIIKWFRIFVCELMSY